MTEKEFELAVLQHLTGLSNRAGSIESKLESFSAALEQVRDEGRQERKVLHKRLDAQQLQLATVVEQFNGQSEMWQQQMQVCGKHLERTNSNAARTEALEQRAARHSREVDFVEETTQVGQEELLKVKAAREERARIMRVVSWTVGLIVAAATVAGLIWTR